MTALLLGALLAVIFAEPVSIGVMLLIHQDDPAIALPPHQPPANLAEARLQDVEDLKFLPGVDRSFSPSARSAFERGVDTLKQGAGAMSPAAFEMAVSRLVALAGNAHTTVDAKQRASRFGRVPLRFAWFADGLYIVRAEVGFADILGTRVAAIDGHPVEGALAAIAPYISGTKERARADSTPLLESPALLQALWPETDGVHLTLSLDAASGPVDRTVVAEAPVSDPFGDQPIFVIGPGQDSADWRTALSQAPQIPLSLREPDRVAYSQALPQDRLYVRINANRDDSIGRLTDQLGSILSQVPPGGWRSIILDLRFNHGGDEIKTAAFTRRLPKVLRRDGTLWVLTGNATFSAAIITAARAKHFVGERTRIIGETVGDRDKFWTDGGAPLVLRNSGVEIGHAYFLHDWVHGCYSISKCYPPGFIYGVAAGDLSPEIRVGWRFADYAAGRDTVMDRVMEASAVVE